MAVTESLLESLLIKLQVFTGGSVGVLPKFVLVELQTYIMNNNNWVW